MERISRLARMEAYLAAVPGGLAAFPECQVKGVLVRMLAAEEAYAGVHAAVPRPLRQLLEEPPMGSEWVPEVHYLALLYALADLVGQDDEAIAASVRARDRRMFESPAYRFLMTGKSPAGLLRGSDLRWGNWHRGSSLDVEGIADDGVRVVIRFPRGLFDGCHLRLFGEAMLAALELAQARAPRAEIVQAEPGLGRYVVAWE